MTFGTDVNRDIELVLITGAGASRSFGLDKPYPLMQEWSDAVVEKLIQAGMPVGDRQLLKIERGMDGPTFERTLGSFLRAADAFRRVGDFLSPSLQIFGMNPQVKAILPSQTSVLEDWYRTTNSRIDEIVQLLTESLFEQFGATAVDEYAAHHGYNWLLQELQVFPGSPFVLATTNYDTVAEAALISLGHSLDWGRPAQLNPGPQADLWVEGLLAGLGRHTPVLHLHGRVGWYKAPNERAKEIVSDRFQASWGLPVVVWPDDEKNSTTYDVYEVISELWRQLRLALRRTKRVLVLGHSLNDSYLMSALRENVPSERTAVTLCASTPEEMNSEANVVISQRVQRLLGPVTWVPMVFGPEESGIHVLRPWYERTAELR